MKYKVTLKFTNPNGTHEKRTFTINPKECLGKLSTEALGILAYDKYVHRNPFVLNPMSADYQRPYTVDSVKEVVEQKYGVDPTSWNPDPEGWGYTAAHDMGI